MIEPTEEIRIWIDKHITEDPNKLRLTWHNKAPWIPAAINHIENIKKTRRKFLSSIPGIDKLIPEFMPIKLSTEQATSAETALLHLKLSQLEHKPQSRVLDMTCGLGIDTSFLGILPSIAVTSIELNEEIYQVAKYNFKHRKNIEIINCNSIDYIESTDKHFDLIFIDPARRDQAGSRVYNLHDCSPNVIQLLPSMKLHSNRIMVKMSPMLDIRQTISDLPGISSINIIEERNECRELLAIINSKPSYSDQPEIVAWKDSKKIFSFTIEEEVHAKSTIRMPIVGDYLYEPYPSIMKAAPFKILSHKFDAAQLSNNTHLFVSEKDRPDFPGIRYTIDDILTYSSSNIKKISRQKIQADVAVRNFKISAETLIKKLNIRQSGSTRIMGVTLANQEPYLLIVSRV